MEKKAQILMVCFTFGYFCLGSFYSASSGTEGVGLEFKGQIMSAELQGVSLRHVLERLENEKGIWFKGDEVALEESISIRFKDLPLHEGLRRILSNINHVLVFDEERGLVGLFILGKKDPGRRAPQIDGQPFTDMSSGREDPFGENAELSPEDPFAEGLTASPEHPFEVFLESESERTGEK